MTQEPSYCMKCAFFHYGTGNPDTVRLAEILIDPCALIQAQYLKQMFDNLSSTAGKAYQNCASNYDDILHKWLSGAVADLRDEIYNDAKNQVQTALKYYYECFDQLKNVKYPYHLGISLKNFCAFLMDAGGVIDQIGR
ncbi:hypothetical protein FCV25MIE_29925 [Fagus crenata]